MRSITARLLKGFVIVIGVCALTIIVIAGAFEGWMLYDNYYYGLRQQAISPDKSLTAYWVADGRHQSTIHRVMLSRRGIHLRHIAFSGYSLSDDQLLSMKLAWTGPRSLEVICSHCDDLTVYVKHDLDSVSITYLEETSSGPRPLVFRGTVH
jgi:hypothetical protein